MLLSKAAAAGAVASCSALIKYAGALVDGVQSKDANPNGMLLKRHLETAMIVLVTHY